MATSGALLGTNVEFWLQFLVWLFQFDIMYSLVTKARDIGSTRSRNSVVELDIEYMHQFQYICDIKQSYEPVWQGKQCCQALVVATLMYQTGQ